MPCKHTGEQGRLPSLVFRVCLTWIPPTRCPIPHSCPSYFILCCRVSSLCCFPTLRVLPSEGWTAEGVTAPGLLGTGQLLSERVLASIPLF